jgi:hypothetical protein
MPSRSKQDPLPTLTNEDVVKFFQDWYNTLPSNLLKDKSTIHAPKWYIDAVMNPPLFKDKK